VRKKASLFLLAGRSKIKSNSTKMKSPDPRFTPFKERIFAFYRWRWSNGECPWDGSEANQLSKLLKSCPKLSIQDFSRWLYNYGQSEDIAPGERPRAFLPRIHRYSVTNLDRYGRDPNVRPGETFAERDEKGNSTAFERARQNRRGPTVNVPAIEQIHDGGKNQSLARRPRVLPSGGD
jgi:hypothetical protein